MCSDISGQGVKKSTSSWSKWLSGMPWSASEEISTDKLSRDKERHGICQVLSFESESAKNDGIGNPPSELWFEIFDYTGYQTAAEEQSL